MATIPVVRRTCLRIRAAARGLCLRVPTGTGARTGVLVGAWVRMGL